MRTLRFALSALAAIAIFAPTRAQDAAPETTQQLIARYAAADAAGRDGLRAKIVGLGADTIRKAIAEWKLERPSAIGINKETTRSEKGVTRGTTTCPDGHERPYWVYWPKSYDPAKSYPLVVNLHGGVSGAPLYAGENSPGLFALDVVRAGLPDDWKENVILLGCSAGAEETSQDARWWRNAGQKNVLHMIREVRRAYNIDDDRIFVGGHSDGGSGAFTFAQRRPDTFAGFFSLCGHPLVGRGDGVNVWLENMKGLNVYAVNGGRDPLYPAAQMTVIYDQAAKAGAKVDTMVFENLTHDITLIVKGQVEQIMKDRVAKQKRNHTPTEIDWTTDSAETGRRAWLAIDEVLDLGEKNSAPASAAIKLPVPRVRLGINVSRDADLPTVESVEKDSTAENLGIKAGDVIVKIDETSIEELQDLLDALGAKKWGDDVKVIVKRGDKEEVLSGKFPKFEDSEPKFPPAARVVAQMQPGTVRLSVRNAGKVSLYVTPAMLAEGKLKVVLTGKDGADIVARESAPVAADAGLILDELTAALDRKGAAIARVEIDVAKALGVERKAK